MSHDLPTVIERLGALGLAIAIPLGAILLVIRYRGTPRPDQYAALFTLVALGGLLGGSPALAVAGLVALLALGLARLLAHVALAGLSYHRTLTPPRLFPGDEAALTVRLRNNKVLPLAWLSIRDPIWLGAMRGHAPPHELLRVAEGAEVVDRVDLALVNGGAIGPFQDLTRTYSLRGMRRGVYSIGPAQVETGDPFGFFRRSTALGGRQEILVYPQIHRSEEVDLVFQRAMGELAAQRSLFEDPVLLAGSREYRPGDPLRRVDWKATARSGAMQVRIFDPSTTAHLMVVLNLKTFRYYWEGIDTERMEEAIRVAASLATWSLDQGYAVGLRSNGILAGVSSDDEAPRLPPSANPRQAAVFLEHLARLSFPGRVPAERVLVDEARRLTEGTSIVFVTALMTPEIEAALTSRQLRRQVSVVYCGGYPAPVVRGVPIHFVMPTGGLRRAIG